MNLRPWHYTLGQHFKSIKAEGLIKPATLHVPNGERAIVWFSTNSLWEQTARKGLETDDGQHWMTMQEMHQVCGLVRIGVDPETAPYDWRDLKELSGMHPKMAGALYAKAIEIGSRPGEWRGTFDPVPKEKWLTVECWNGKQWAPEANF
jgi:hypothetical protein